MDWRTIPMHLLSNEFGPWDRLLEFLVFALIAFEVGANLREKYKAGKRAKQIEERSKKISDYISEGHRLFKTAPPMKNPSIHTQDDMNAAYERAQGWESSLATWILNVNRLLIGYSAMAATAFVEDAPSNPHIDYIGVATYARESYSQLAQRLINLRSIMEKPDRYL